MKRPTSPCSVGDRVTLRYVSPVGGDPQYDDPPAGVTGTVVAVRWDSWIEDHRLFVDVDGRHGIRTHYVTRHLLAVHHDNPDLLDLLGVPLPSLRGGLPM